MFKIYVISVQEAEKEEGWEKKCWKIISQLKMFRFAEGFKYTNSRNSRTPAR